MQSNNTLLWICWQSTKYLRSNSSCSSASSWSVTFPNSYRWLDRSYLLFFFFFSSFALNFSYSSILSFLVCSSARKVSTPSTPGGFL